MKSKILVFFFLVVVSYVNTSIIDDLEHTLEKKFLDSQNSSFKNLSDYKDTLMLLSTLTKQGCSVSHIEQLFEDLIKMKEIFDGHHDITFLDVSQTMKMILDNQCIEVIASSSFSSQENENLSKNIRSLKNFIKIAEKVLLYLPQNMATILANINTHSDEIAELVESITDFKSLVSNTIKIVTIIFKDADYGDMGLDSFVELRTFDDCFGRLMAEKQYQTKVVKAFMKLFVGKEKLDDLFSLLKETNTIMNNAIDGCQAYYHHVQDLSK